MKNHVKEGKFLNFVPSANVASGQGVLLGSDGLFGVSTGNVLSGEEGVAAISEVYTLPKLNSDTAARFAAAYWDNGNSRVTTTEGSNTKIGVFANAAAGGTTTADILLIPSV